MKNPTGLNEDRRQPELTAGAGADRKDRPRLDVRGAFLRRTDLSSANLEYANLSGADFSHAIFRGADFRDAILDGTVLTGADLTNARNLTRLQLKNAIVDETTKLPDGLSLDDIVQN